MKLEKPELLELLNTIICPLELLIQTQADKISAMASLIEDLVESNACLSKKLDSIVRQNDGHLAASFTGPSASNSEPFPCLGEADGPAMLYSQVVKNERNPRRRQLPESTSIQLQNRFNLLGMLDEREQMKEKKLNAVIVNIPECENDDDTEVNDLKTVQEIFRTENLPVEQIRKVNRHGRKRPNKPRVLKVYTDDETLRNKFIRAYNRHRVPVGPKSFCRRDLTVTELLLDGELRREAYRRNTEIGMRRWTVRDLQLVELREPQLLPHQNYSRLTAKNDLNSSTIPPTANSDLLEDSLDRSHESNIPKPSHVSKPKDKPPSIVPVDNPNVTSRKSKSGK